MDRFVNIRSSSCVLLASIMAITVIICCSNNCSAQLSPSLPRTSHSSSSSSSACKNNHQQTSISCEKQPSAATDNQPRSSSQHTTTTTTKTDPKIESVDNGGGGGGGNQCQSKSTDIATQTPSIYDFDCEQLNFCDDRAGFEAILYLHRQLDEDANGDIDIAESDEFIRDELKYENGAERQKAFHGNDKHISVDELWRTWCVSTVHNWTVDETIEWLTEVVELPRYQDKFLAHGINGITLPRLASNPHIYSQLGINNPIHKQKIALKAMDVVLFGVPKQKSTQKDLIMGFLFVFATVVGWYAYYQQKYSKEYIRKMMKDIEALSNAEQQLETLQTELEKTKQLNEETFKENRNLEQKLKQHSTNSNDMVVTTDVDGHNKIRELEEELAYTKAELRRVEQAYQSRQWIPSRALQPYLQLTYEIETRYYNSKKAAAERQLQAAREGCEKLKRKRSSILGAFRMAHSSNIDFVDNTILQARTLLAELTQEMQERIKRWKQIESYCCFEIIHNRGLVNLEHQLYGGPKTSPSSSSLSQMLRRGSEATLAEEDSISIMSGGAVSANHFPAYNNYNANTTAQALQMWHSHNQLPSSIPLKKLSTSSAYGSPICGSPSSEENFPNGFSIISGGDQSSTNGGGGNNRKAITNNVNKKSSIGQNDKSHLFFSRRGSSDGVEKHFEQLKKSGSQNSCCSQSDPNISDNLSICSAYYQPKTTNPNPSTSSISDFNTDNLNNDNQSIISIQQQQQPSKPKELLFEKINDETASVSSNDSTLTVNNSVGSDDLSHKSHKSNKKRKFFAIGKRNK